MPLILLLPLLLALLGLVALLFERTQRIQELRQALLSQQESLEQAQAETEAAREEVKGARAQRARFLAAVSREVRTPLTGVVGMASLLLDSDLNERQRQQARTIAACGESLLDIVNNALELSRIESGQLVAEPGVFDLPALVEQCVELASQQGGDDKDLSIAGLLDPTLPRRVVGDVGLLRGVLGQLLNNAVRYTPAGDVVLRVSPRGEGRVRFEVTDSGPGLSDEARKGLFQPFTAPGSRRQEGGAGLGLAICKHVIEHLGGQIDVVSKPGRGSTFWFEVPLPEGDGLLQIDPTTGEALPPPKPSGQAIGEAMGRVLLVEDNPVNQQVAAALLRRLGYSIEVVEDGEPAVARASTQDFDIILMDCEMPGLDGFEATRRIRAADRASTHRVPIIAMTAHALRGDRERCLEAGMDDYIAKPVDLARLGRVLARWVGSGPSEPSAQAADATEEMPSPSADALAALDSLPHALPPRSNRTFRMPTPSTPRSASTFIVDEEEDDGIIVDVAGLRELEAARAPGSPSPMRMILTSFLQEAEADLTQILHHTQTHSSEDLRRHLHRLKGAASTVGAVSLALRCGALEDEVRGGMVDDLNQRVSELQELFKGTRELLLAELDMLPR